MTTGRTGTWTRLQNINRSRCRVDLTDKSLPTVIEMAEAVVQPALQQVARPLSLIPVGLYVHIQLLPWSISSFELRTMG
jgi:hypothetical protein